MIICHAHKFIFIKTRKTAGTSIEIALSQFCGPDDILTRLDPEDERIRQELGFRGPQNYILPLRAYKPSDWYRLIKRRKRMNFANHAPAGFIRENIGAEVWNGYFKFCFERNPFDQAISRYYWSTSEPRPEINAYLCTLRPHLLSNWDIYAIDGRIAVDFIGRYENLSGDLAFALNKIGLPGDIQLPRAKAGYRADRRPYSQILNDMGRARIEEVCRRELEAFHYTWD
jgi:hypothetical protein